MHAAAVLLRNEHRGISKSRAQSQEANQPRLRHGRVRVSTTVTAVFPEALCSSRCIGTLVLIHIPSTCSAGGQEGKGKEAIRVQERQSWKVCQSICICA